MAKRNADLSKETFPYIPCPRLSPELIGFLDQSFPEECARLDESLPSVYYKSGQRAVVKFLIRIFEEQNENV